MKDLTPTPQRYLFQIVKSTCILFSLLLLSSCYTVQITSKDGTGAPDPLNQVHNSYKNLKVDTLTKVLKLNIEHKEYIMFVDCASEDLYSVEYKVTLGGLLLSAITFGRHRRVKIRYVCAQVEIEN